jgi:tetratricopeptide (TPR) repeat protein
VKSRDYTDVFRHSERAIDRSRQVRWAAGEASAHHNMALACWNIGRLRSSLAHGEIALAMNRKSGRKRAASVNLGVLGVVHGEMGELQVERRLHAEALGIAEELGNVRLQASHLRSLASVSIYMGAVDAAEQYLGRVMDIEVDSGERELGESTAAFIAELLAVRGRYDDALAYGEMVVRHADLRGDRTSKAIGLTAVAVALNGLGRHAEGVAAAAQALRVVNGEMSGIRINALIERAIGRIGLDEAHAAETDARTVLDLAEEGEYRTGEAMARNLFAEVRLHRGEAGEARGLAERALEDHRSSGHRAGQAWSLWVMGAAAQLEGDAAGARSHWREVEEIYGAMGAPVPSRFTMSAEERS